MPELMDGVGVGAVILCLHDGDIGVILDTFPYRSEASVFWVHDGLCETETVTNSNSHVFKILVKGKYS